MKAVIGLNFRFACFLSINTVVGGVNARYSFQILFFFMLVPVSICN